MFVVRRCHNPSCAALFVYEPSVQYRIEAAAAAGFVQVEEPEEPSGVAFYCDRCAREHL